MRHQRRHVTGVLGWDGEAFGDAYELPPVRAYAETCAAIGALQRARDPLWMVSIWCTGWNSPRPASRTSVSSRPGHRSPSTGRTCWADVLVPAGSQPTATRLWRD
jgi:hypothetical protein